MPAANTYIRKDYKSDTLGWASGGRSEDQGKGEE